MLFKVTEGRALAVLMALSLITHFAFFGYPNQTVFDEVHFGKFISAYFTHEYYFDIHPPLGKLVLAGWGRLWEFRPGFSFGAIGDRFPDNAYMALRFLPSLAGALLPLVVYGLARRLRISRTGAFVAGAFVALDNALVLQSRLILLDSFLLLSGFGAVYCYLTWLARHHVQDAPSHELCEGASCTWWLIAAGLLAGVAFSIKWTGLTFLALVAILEIVRILRRVQQKPFPAWSVLASAVRSGLALIAIPIIVYYLVFMAHFALLTKSGTGDAFMTKEFQHDLSGNQYAKDHNVGSVPIIQKFIELNVQMYQSNQRLTATHPYGSAWYAWPLMVRPIFYWVKDTARIYLIGNPLIWWTSTVATLILGATLLLTGLRNADRTATILLGAWLMNILPFIGITRVMFVYHYFTALVWAVLMLSYLADRIPNRRRISFALTGLALVAFIFFAPLTYGLPLSDSSYNARVWLRSWR